MIRHKLGRLVQWKEGDAHMVGQVVEVGIYPETRCLVSLAHTGELVSVEWRELSDYPSEPIEEPTK